jgi:single-strand DNA-binding protein
MASYNKVILIGNLTRDPQVRYTPKGTAVSEIGLAVNTTWFDKASNTRKEETTFVDVVLWGRQAELASEYLSKGRPVLIEGRLQLDTWDDKESGQKRSKMRVVAEEMQFLGSPKDGQGGGGARSGGGGSQGRRPASEDEFGGSGGGSSGSYGGSSGGYGGSSGGYGGSTGGNSGGFGGGRESSPPVEDFPQDEVPF